MSRTETDTLDVAPRTSTFAMPLPLMLALRELRAGLGGFYVFIACVALGVAVIASVGALSDALRSGLERQGERILGGDATVSRMHKRIEPAERAWLATRATVSETATMRSMARTPDGSEATLVELKGIDALYPLAGEVVLKDGRSLSDAVRRAAEPSAAVDAILLERLRLKLGDVVRLGALDVRIASIIDSEPDTISDRLTFGPRVMVTADTLERTGLVQPGTLIRWRYALKLDGAGEGPEGLISFREALKTGLPEAGFVVADRRDPSPQISRTLERLRQFLTLIGLTALIVGGVGVANAVATFIDRRRKTIATMKSLGATGSTIFQVFLVQVMLIAGIGVLIGLAIGLVVPVIVNGLYGDALPIRAEITVTPFSIASAALYGLLVALVFALWPLGKAELVRPAVLFRDEVAPDRRWPRLRVIALTILAAGLLMTLAVLGADARRVAIYFCLGLTVALALFFGLGTFVSWVARRIPRPPVPAIALALGNLGGPGGLTRSVVVSLGSGLSLLVAVALADASLQEELSSRAPKESPNYFVLDLSKADRAEFQRIVTGIAPMARIDEAPMLRGRMVRIKGEPVESIKAPPEAQWVLNGDRGLTYAEAVPDGSKVIAGAWWTPDYTGEPLVSFEAELAKHLGITIGDQVTVNVLGRNITARVSSLREVKWESLAINFVMVFSPNTLRAAPHNLLATIALPETAPMEQEARIARELGKALPSVTAIRVKDALNAFNTVFQKVMTAVRVAGSVTLVAGALVLAGALATAQRRRIQQAVILKALGATRARILSAHTAEYAILAVVTATLAVLLGAAAAWLVTTRLMDLEFVLSIPAILQALGLSLALVLAFGGIGTWAVLRAPAVPYLRSE